MNLYFKSLKNGDVFVWKFKGTSAFYKEKYLMVNKKLNSPGQCVDLLTKEKNYFGINDTTIVFKILSRKSEPDDTAMDFL